jgi:tRNA A-37 threonylcarbamoyl transferase component Bud32
VGKKQRYVEIAKKLESAGDHLNAAAGYIAIARRGDPSRYGNALENLLRISKDRPEYVRAQTMLAEMLAEQGDVAGGLTVLQRLLAGIAPTKHYVPALYQLGRLLEMRGLEEAARDAYASAAELEPRFMDVEVRRAHLDTRIGERRAVEREPMPRPVEPRSAEAGPGLVLRERYELERKVGVGGQAEVWLANDLLLHRRVAIKILNQTMMADRSAIDRFLREARIAARIRHPKCIQVFDFGQAAGLTFMAMEYFEGTTLREKMKSGAIPISEAIAIGIDVAEAIAAAHENGIVHRDVKPSNIMVGAEGNVRLADFGVARVIGGEHTSQGVMIGSMGYMSPEQASGKEADPRSDLYALGIVIFEMLTGTPPFSPTIESLAKRLVDPPPALPPRVPAPPTLARALEKAMQPEREDRYPDVRAMIADLEAAKVEIERTEDRRTRTLSLDIEIIESATNDVQHGISADVDQVATEDLDRNVTNKPS